jgi:hypothetical protein
MYALFDETSFSSFCDETSNFVQSQPRTQNFDGSNPFGNPSKQFLSKKTNKKQTNKNFFFQTVRFDLTPKFSINSKHETKFYMVHTVHTCDSSTCSGNKRILTNKQLLKQVCFFFMNTYNGISRQ